MATTRIWKVMNNLPRVVAYAEDGSKTENPRWSNKDYQALRDVMDYAMNDAKTEQQYYVTGLNCNADYARYQMQMTKKQYGKTDGILAWHGYQSFAEGEVDADTAHEIGVKLAKELWPDFQVVVATHLNTHCCHNHFVVNSVSYLHGKKFNACKDSYRRMRFESDRLCREYGLSIVEKHQAYYPKHYAEWEAEARGERTWRSSIREDVDRAVARSMTWNAFLHSLRAEGYEIKTGVKHIAIRPPGKERFVRLRSLGDAYTEEAIRNRILRQQRPALPRAHPSQPRRVKVYGDFRLHKITWKGLRALYYHYLAMIRKARRQNSPAPFLFREDVRHLQALSEQAQFLHRYGIETAEQLSAHRADCDGNIILLCMERKQLKNELRREGTGPERKEEIAARIIAINDKLKELRKEVRLCDDILIRSVQIREKLRKVNEKEELIHEPHGRSSGTNREYGHQRNREGR